MKPIIQLLLISLFLTGCKTEPNLQKYMIATWETTYIKIIMPNSNTDKSRIYEDDFSKPNSTKAQSTYYKNGNFEAWYLTADGEKKGLTTGKWYCVKDTLRVNYIHNKRTINASYKIEKTKEGFKATSIYDWSNNGINNDTLYMRSKKIIR